jgi:hypothetical protein
MAAETPSGNATWKSNTPPTATKDKRNDMVWTPQLSKMVAKQLFTRFFLSVICGGAPEAVQ